MEIRLAALICTCDLAGLNAMLSHIISACQPGDRNRCKPGSIPAQGAALSVVACSND
ncbi:hypothetical protein [Nonomuraea sp. NPDC050786]|uniref:hypothetical protein n=1 Tax=Nonomuraea sp. NPDC050786 TaxID=3154840 RepID=UPI0033F21140